jgi:DNA-binding winged helix-turn-helix (wHTH) protein
MNKIPQGLGLNDRATVDQLEIAGLTLDLRREELRDDAGKRIELRNRSFGVLRQLATNAGRMVTKHELLDMNWPGVTVTEDSLTQCISEIRRALGDAGRDVVRTVPRRGYMVVIPDRPETDAGLCVEEIPRAEWYRSRRAVIPCLAGAALLAILGIWALTTGTGAPLATSRASATPSRGPTVAVLPFENKTGDAGQDALADGLTQAMISSLGRFSELNVLSRGMTSAYRGRVPSAIDSGMHWASIMQSKAI